MTSIAACDRHGGWMKRLPSRHAAPHMKRSPLLYTTTTHATRYTLLVRSRLVLFASCPIIRCRVLSYFAASLLHAAGHSITSWCDKTSLFTTGAKRPWPLFQVDNTGVQSHCDCQSITISRCRTDRQRTKNVFPALFTTVESNKRCRRWAAPCP